MEAKSTATKPRFFIGHSAYSDANRPGAATSKAAAVRELRARGAKRDDARAAVNRAAKGAHTTVRGEGFDVIEIQPAFTNLFSH